MESRSIFMQILDESFAYGIPILPSGCHSLKVSCKFSSNYSKTGLLLSCRSISERLANYESRCEDTAPKNISMKLKLEHRDIQNAKSGTAGEPLSGKKQICQDRV
jgi:hypothetical protein